MKFLASSLLFASVMAGGYENDVFGAALAKRNYGYGDAYGSSYGNSYGNSYGSGSAVAAAEAVTTVIVTATMTESAMADALSTMEYMSTSTSGAYDLSTAVAAAAVATHTVSLLTILLC
jgi:hypothetical protein